jgi:hypothetical protein
MLFHRSQTRVFALWFGVSLGLMGGITGYTQELLAQEFSDTQLKQVAASPKWLRLLHYKPGGATKWVSQLDGPGFFFSKTGKTDPLEELRATLKGLGEDLTLGSMKQKPQCAFPERYRFLKKEFGLKYSEYPCPQYKKYIDNFKAKSLSLIFSSATPNNPASMFGHTFMKVNSGSKSELLDYGVNFAATVSDDENPFAFVALGTFGGYVGQYSLLPYYQKVQEYINLESRDLWEYELNISEEETLQILSHLWEMETNSHFAYFFFDENCSYQLLAAIEAVKTDWDLTDFPIYVIPGESVKMLTDIPGAIREVRFRPSLQKKMIQHVRALDPQEKEIFFKVRKTRAGVDDVSSPLVLDALAINYQYERLQAGGKPTAEDNLFQQAVLKKRASVAADVSSRLEPIVGETRPDLGHDSYRLGVWPGMSFRGGGQGRYFQELSIKSAYHDLLNYDLGYSRYSHIDFPALDLRWNDGDRVLHIEKLTGLEVTSLFPLSFIEKRLSWKFSGHIYSPKDFGCTYCQVAHLEGGVGGAIDLFTPKVLFYTLALANFELGDSFQLGYRYGPKVQSYFLLNPWLKYKLRAGADLFWEINSFNRSERLLTWNLEQSYSLERNLEVRLLLQQIVPSNALQEKYSESKLNLNYYFN